MKVEGHALAASARGSREQRVSQCALGVAGIDRDVVLVLGGREIGERAGLDPEGLGELEPSRVSVHVADLAGAARACHVGDQQPGWTGAHDQHVGARAIGEVRGDDAPRVGQVVPRGDGLQWREGRGERHERVRGEGHADQLGEQAPVIRTNGHPVDGEPVGGRQAAVQRDALQASIAAPARNVIGDHGDVSRGDAGDLVSDLDDFADALVPDRERGLGAGDAALEDRLIQVARRDRNRPDERISRLLQHRRLAVAPFHAAGAVEVERLHGVSPLARLRVAAGSVVRRVRPYPSPH